MTRADVAYPLVWKVAAALGALYLIWGSVYLAVRVAVNFWPPFLLVGVRFLLAGAIILAWARWRGAPWPGERVRWRNVAVVGLLMVTGANGGVTWGVQYVGSGLAAVLIATVPMWLILLEALRPGGDQPHWSAIAGLALGVVGVAILFQPNVGVAENIHVLVGQLVLAGAALMWALGSIYVRQFSMPRSLQMSTALQMLIGGSVLVAIGLLRGELVLVPRHLEFWPVIAFLFMVFFGSVMGYSTYQWLIQTTRPALVATYAYVNPVVAVVLGVLVLDEAITLAILAGSTLVIVAAFLIQRVRG